MLIRLARLLPLLVSLWFGLVGCGPAYRLSQRQSTPPELAAPRLLATGIASGEAEARRP
ncbi:MAG: hypothetical protein ACKN89_06640 [Cyanobium sp.]|jgi:hypothetical protein|nr:hypothetical protein [Synechococcaceae cyanobacterium]